MVAECIRFPMRQPRSAANIWHNILNGSPRVNPSILPLLVEPAELESKLSEPGLLLVDLNRPELYTEAHLPGAVRLEYADIVASKSPATGLLPDADKLSAVLGAIGLTPDTHVVAYDSEGNSR